MQQIPERARGDLGFWSTETTEEEEVWRGRSYVCQSRGGVLVIEGGFDLSITTVCRVFILEILVIFVIIIPGFGIASKAAFCY